MALEALREEATLQELSVKYSVHPNQIMQWKKLVAENAASIFERTNKKNEEDHKADAEKDELMKVIGEQKIENEYLKKKYVSSFAATRSTGKSRRHGRVRLQTTVDKPAV